MQVANLQDNQPAITIEVDGELHIISVVTIRLLANGAPYLGDRDKLLQLMAIAIRDLTDDNYSL